MKLKNVFAAVCVGAAAACSVQASDAVKPAATVNGVRIGGEVLEL